MKAGIVGLPNVGKSTLFNAILKREQALSANYPFATIEPNVGIVEVMDSRLNALAKLVEIDIGILPPVVYATIEFVDIAGLVKGASKGEGLGNQFLANIREVDLILHVVRDFSDPNIVREHSKDPETDIEIINSELILKDIESIEKRLISIRKKPENNKEADILQKYMDHLNSGKPALDLKPQIDKNDYSDFIQPMFLLTDKEVIYVFNVDENDDRLTSSNPPIEYNNKPVIFLDSKLESELSSISLDDQKAYLKQLGIKESGLDKITKMAFELLGQITFLTAGKIEVKAWEIKKGTTASKAAGKIHTDFEKNFIKAEVVSYNDYIKAGTKQKAREMGKLRLEGKDYVVKDGDVIEFKIGA